MRAWKRARSFLSTAAFERSDTDAEAGQGAPAEGWAEARRRAQG